VQDQVQQPPNGRRRRRRRGELSGSGVSLGVMEIQAPNVNLQLVNGEDDL